MSAVGKRKGRVQGGWAPPSNVRSDKNREKASASPAWTGKIVDQPMERKFVYEPVEECKEVPKEKVISKPGVYDISTEPSGVSRLRFFPEFIDPKEADEIYEHLFHELPWRQRSDVKDGETYLQPRLTAWYGEFPYSYSGVTHEINTEWTPTLLNLMERMECILGIKFNSMLANMYRDGKDHVAWHSDDEPSLGPEPPIASLSFGDQRSFQLRKKPTPEEKEDYTYSPHIKVPLTHGSLLIMEGCTQADWQHRIPREYHDRNTRINLTFRVIYQN